MSIRHWLLLILVLVIVVPVHAQNIPDPPPPEPSVVTPAFTFARFQSITLDMSQTEVASMLGKPDGVDGGTELWKITDSPEHMLGMVEYLDGRVSMLALAFKPGVTSVEKLTEIKKKAGAIPVSIDDGRAVFVLQVDGSEKKIYSIIEPSEDETTIGPMEILMNEAQFNLAEEPAGDGVDDNSAE